MKKLLLIGFALAAVCFGGIERAFLPAQHDAATNSTRGADQVLADAFDNHQGNIQVQGGGRISRILADDQDGSRHQRFIVQLESGQTLLVAHNIDLADRVASPGVGDAIEFNGEYEWNAKGGVIHWTHHDPRGSHEAGWIRHHGHTYQ